MQVLHRDTIKRGGFAGLTEHRLVVDPKIFGHGTHPGTWLGIGNFIYLADARFLPHGDTRMHGHKEVDVISAMAEGRIAHEGSLEHGQELSDRGVQVQRAGGEGFMHNEVNPDGRENRMIQMWVLPEVPGQRAGYKYYPLTAGEVTRVYGGSGNQDQTFAAKTVIDVALLNGGQDTSVEGTYLAYVVSGGGEAGGQTLRDGDLARGEDFSFTASRDTHLITVYLQ